jgi:hypothetical protein
METTEKNDPTFHPSEVPAQPGVARPWVKNLLAGQGFSLSESVQFWWSVHLEAFLRYARKREPNALLDQLATDYLTGLQMEHPTVHVMQKPGTGVKSPLDTLGS